MIKRSTIKFQRGALLLLTLIMLLIISILGMSALDTTGMEMQMSSNHYAQQRVFEAAEFTLSRLENDIRNSRFSDNNFVNNTAICNNICFNASCPQGYCFDGTLPADWRNCALNVPARDAYETEAFWKNGGGSHLTLAVPANNITAKYFLEFRCYTALDFRLPIEATNFARVFRITAYVSSDDNKARTLLRSTISLSPEAPSWAELERRRSWEILNIPF